MGNSNMKVFATLATIVGASAATPLFQNQLQGTNDMRMNQHSMNNVMKPSMGMSMESQISQRANSNRRMDMNRQVSNMRDMYRDNQDMMNHNIMSQDISPNMMGQERSSNMREMPKQNQAMGFTGPNQYFVKDNFGNYVYSYNDQQSEKSEEGNNQSIRGQYAYIMSNGIKRRVEYIADNNGFHIIRDNADPARIKRSTEPDLLQTRMTSMMDSSSLRDDTRDMYRMSNQMGRDMPSNRNLMDLKQQRYSNMMGQDSMNRNIMGQDTMGRNMMGQNIMGRNMMGRNIYNIVSNRGMNSDVSNMLGQEMNSNMMGRDMTMMSRNMLGQDRNSQLMSRNMLGRQEMTPNTMYSNMMGQDKMEMFNNQISSNMLNSHRMSSDMKNLSNNGLMGQRMMQKMEIERVPETYTSTRFF